MREEFDRGSPGPDHAVARVELEDAIAHVEKIERKRERERQRTSAQQVRLERLRTKKQGNAPVKIIARRAGRTGITEIEEADLQRQREKQAKDLGRNSKSAQEEKRQLKRKSLRQQKKEAKLLEKRRLREEMERETTLRARAARLSASRAQLAEVASPAPSLSFDGRLDAGPNPAYDTPIVDDDLPTLPIRQRTLIKTILGNLPRNAPKYLSSALDNYDDELKARGVQPILGVLKDMAAIIEATVDAADAREWLEKGIREAFKRFNENHALFVKHFPLDPKREELYAQTPVDEDNAVGPVLSGPFESVAVATRDANRAGVTTDDFLKVVDRMAEFARVISTQPPSPRYHRRTTTKSENKTAEFPTVGPDDRIMRNGDAVSTKKRMLLSGFGFFERVYNLLGTSAQLTGPPEGNSLLTAIRGAVSALSKLVG
jgi:hypothetical protein